MQHYQPRPVIVSTIRLVVISNWYFAKPRILECELTNYGDLAGAVELIFETNIVYTLDRQSN